MRPRPYCCSTTCPGYNAVVTRAHVISIPQRASDRPGWLSLEVSLLALLISPGLRYHWQASLGYQGWDVQLRQQGLHSAAVRP